MLDNKSISENPIHGQVAAISVGIVDDSILLDLDYPEDSTAQTDMNFVMNDEGGFIEVQGTAEQQAFSLEQMVDMAALAKVGIAELIEIQKQALAQEIQ